MQTIAGSARKTIGIGGGLAGFTLGAIQEDQNEKVHLETGRRPICAAVLLRRACGDGYGVTTSNANPNVGDTFFLTVSGAAFPDTIGASLGLTFSGAVALATPTITSPTALATDGLTIVGTGSPFTGGITGATGGDAGPFPSGGGFTLLAPPSGALPTGSFTAFQINMIAVAPGLANIVLNESAGGWADANALPIVVTYTQATVTVQAAAGPDITVTNFVPAPDDLAVARECGRLGAKHRDGDRHERRHGTPHN